MNKDDCFELGYIEKARGLVGEVVAVFDADNPERYTSIDAVFIEEGNHLVPYLVDKIQPYNDKFILKLEEIDSVEKASSKRGNKLFLPLTALPSLKEDEYYLHDLPGFLVVDKNKGSLGEINGVIEANQNVLLSMIYEGKEVLIPLQDDIVEKVNKSNKEIHTVLPDGLLEIYLES